MLETRILSNLSPELIRLIHRSIIQYTVIAHRLNMASRSNTIWRGDHAIHVNVELFSDIYVHESVNPTQSQIDTEKVKYSTHVLLRAPARVGERDNKTTIHWSIKT